MRMVWQDRSTKSLKWGEFVQAGRVIQLRQGGDIKGFPKLDTEHHELVQMERIDNQLVVGVRDDEKGELLSGWVAIDLGVEEMPHGDHSDYNYAGPPSIRASVLDKKQGNPAHLYVYDKEFYVANDALNGFTVIRPSAISGPQEGRKGTFHRGGGGHITMAAVGHKVVYSTWIQEKGRVDVSRLDKSGEESLAYSFTLPSGGLHGATANSGRIFLAPSDGIYWVDADLELKQNKDTVVQNHLSLGKVKEGERPLRTGSFTNHRNWVLFNTGDGESSALCLVDASAKKPEVVSVPIKVADGLSLTPPEIISAASGKHYAFLFQDRREGEVKEQLTIVDLDPNGDRNFSDATVAKTLPVGGSKVEGHYGHHTIAFDDDRRWGVMTNPADGDLWLIWLPELKVVGKFKVGGTPTKITVIGGEADKH
ncbi:hypothetical protein [Caulifigura coniformis]|nr:hypothetical protein [Caulifigura coniformis]